MTGQSKRMSSIVVRNLTKRFGASSVVNDISFVVNKGEILVIVGASGCGKTTTLRCIAGLEQPTSGTIEIDGVTVVSDEVFIPPERRGVGMMFQSYALWPNKSVFDNVAYGLSLKKLPKEKIRALVGSSLQTVGLAHLADRFPSMLSGGQQQRVALARAAVVEPRVLLLDEPLSNLDAKLREQMRIELRELVKSLKMTAVHITHDQSEAMAIADKVIYMREGRVEQEAPPRELYNHPVNRHVAEFVGTATFFNGEIVGSAGTNATKIRIANSLELIAAVVPDHLKRVVVALRPEAVQLTPADSERKNSFSAVVRSGVFLGESTEYVLEVGGISMKCKVREEFSIGAAVFASIDPRDVICLPEMEELASYQVSARQ